ncbi:hypothetical protein WJX81_008167 [Elliptochloris bilobata]|uniref:Uncharacterized protein n=1 Tax=Elliptochloris bilobata TaxID=381761 RepID=A0AAW1RE43_9CHLO
MLSSPFRRAEPQSPKREVTLRERHASSAPRVVVPHAPQLVATKLTTWYSQPGVVTWPPAERACELGSSAN